MDIFPAIDLYEGHVVRLTRGDYAKKTVYSGNPAEVAQRWESAGCRWLHIVDLEGAKAGRVLHWRVLESIRKSVHCRIQFGGGVRSEDDIRRILEMGVERIILGTKALEDAFLTSTLGKFGANIAVSLDIKDGCVQTRGWLHGASVTLSDAVDTLNRFPISTIIYTDIKKDGMMAGPNLPEFEKVLTACKARVLLAGGVSGIGDIKICKAINRENFGGVIIGKALFEPDFSLTEALTIARR
jgi:phosphoribosylformimino-5-aminoimidazole carboxamide ribotide isomerase